MPLVRGIKFLCQTPIQAIFLVSYTLEYRIVCLWQQRCFHLMLPNLHLPQGSRLCFTVTGPLPPVGGARCRYLNQHRHQIYI